jgi:hypothetical protein
VISSGAELDSLTVKDMESRYGISKSNIYNRINGLKALGYEMEPEKQGNKATYNASQIAVMDELDSYLKSGKNPITSFPPASQFSSQITGQDNRTIRQVSTQQSYRTNGQDSVNLPVQGNLGNFQPSYAGQDNPQESYIEQSTSQVSYIGQDNLQESYQSQDTQRGLKLPAIFTTDLIELFVQRINTIFPPSLSPADQGLELVHLRELEEAYEKGWQLTTNNIANLLGLKASTISGYGQQFEDAGFIFTRVGKRKGGQLAWLVRKVPRPTELLD